MDAGSLEEKSKTGPLVVACYKAEAAASGCGESLSQVSSPGRVSLVSPRV